MLYAVAPAQGTKRFPIGLIASGLTYCYLEHALTEMGLSGRIPLLKLGLTYPLDQEPVRALAQQVQAIYVIEEKRGFVEGQVVQILNDARQSEGAVPPAVWGKKFPQGLPGIPETRGLNPSLIVQYVAPILLDALRDVPDV